MRERESDSEISRALNMASDCFEQIEFEQLWERIDKSEIWVLRRMLNVFGLVMELAECTCLLIYLLTWEGPNFNDWGYLMSTGGVPYLANAR